jgi:hypothetical protein
MHTVLVTVHTPALASKILKLGMYGKQNSRAMPSTTTQSTGFFFHSHEWREEVLDWSKLFLSRKRIIKCIPFRASA